ncbi:MAG: hypothetical protein KJ737_18445 [Proteobacteria bacterium]|nr:hypothetical protein [Pseudomonadota bacterium]
MQWHQRYDSLTGIIKNAKPLFDDDREYLEKIEDYLKSIKEIFITCEKDMVIKSRKTDYPF